MTFARKIFIAVFLSTLIVGTSLIWAAHKYVESRAESEFLGRYTVFASVLADTLTRLDVNTEALMVNAAQVVVAQDKEKGLLSTDELRQLQARLGITHLFVIDKNGRFIRSTNEDPANIPNLFSFSPRYKKLLTGELQIEATPIIKPNPEPKPFKFLSIANHDRTRIIEVGVRLDFIANTLVEAVSADKNVLTMSLYAPDGTTFGTFAPNNMLFESQKAELPHALSRPVETADEIKFYTKVKSSHPQCGQCDVSGTSIGGEYYYVLESRISKATLNAIQTRASYIFIFVGFANLLLSWLLARFLARRLVKNIETAVTRVRSMKVDGGLKGRINLDSDDELSFLTQEFDRLLESLEDSQRKLIESEMMRSKVELARIVAHNIRSPVLAIEMMIPGLVHVPDRMKTVLQNAVREIKQLSDKLKTQADSMIPTATEIDSDLVFMPLFLEDLVSQKEFEFSGLSQSKIALRVQKEHEGTFVRASAVELRGVLSNIINNASESYGDDGGIVEVSFEQRLNECVIQICDSGAGIPNDYLAQLGSKVLSLKGDACRGLGLFHAFKKIEGWSGKIEIRSALGAGTTVTMFLPKYRGEEFANRQVSAAHH